MASVVETATNLQGKLVSIGLSQPSTRGLVVGAAVGSVAYLAKFPKQAFREEDQSMKPFSLLSDDPEATPLHFLLLPTGAALAAFLFT